MVVANGECSDMEFASFTHGARQKAAEFGFTSFLLIKVGACIPDPVAPWHPAHPLLRYKASPSFAVPCPSGSSFPSGLIAISHLRISSEVGVLPRPYVGLCATAISQTRSAAAAKQILCKTIVHAPIARDSPRLHAVVGAGDAEVCVQRFIPVFGNFGARGLHRSQLVRAARHQNAFFAVPVPVIAEPRMRHRKR